ncbi:NADPH-dependent F420 reductase [Phenylobacterium sp.]|uniref:NADPH-dependent F420 reductase n=1 Tax=Phenylobacterium sp. TaxID=1871053 RepID=UPI003BAA90E7
MRIAIIGAGAVGGALARGWTRAGHDIVFGVSDPSAAKHAALRAQGFAVASNREAAGAASAIALAVPWAAIEDAVASLGDVAGKLILDATNPLAFGPDGLSLAIGFTDSGGEQVQRLASGASVFKTMNQVGYRVMDAATGYPTAPSMFVAGDDEGRKIDVMGLVADLGFEPLDCGGLRMARLLEPYAMVWINQVAVRGAPDTSAFALMHRR